MSSTINYKEISEFLPVMASYGPEAMFTLSAAAIIAIALSFGILKKERGQQGNSGDTTATNISIIRYVVIAFSIILFISGVAILYKHIAKPVYKIRGSIVGLKDDIQQVQYDSSNEDTQMFGRQEVNAISKRGGIRKFTEEFIIIRSSPFVAGDEFRFRLIDRNDFISQDEGDDEEYKRYIYFKYDGSDSIKIYMMCKDVEGIFLRESCKAKGVSHGYNDIFEYDYGFISSATAQEAHQNIKLYDFAGLLGPLEDAINPDTSVPRKLNALRKLNAAKETINRNDTVNSVFDARQPNSYRAIAILSRHSDEQIAAFANSIMGKLDFFQKIGIYAQCTYGCAQSVKSGLRPIETESIIPFLKVDDIIRSGAQVDMGKLKSKKPIGSMALVPTSTRKGDAYYVVARMDRFDKNLVACIDNVAPGVLDSNIPHDREYIFYQYRRNWDDASRLLFDLRGCGIQAEFSRGDN